MSGWLLLAALLVLAPISWLWPSSRERLRMKWRQQAATSGVRVRLGPLKIKDKMYPATAYQWVRESTGAPLSYMRWLRQPHEPCDDSASENKCTSSIGWYCDQGDESRLNPAEYQALQHFLQALPDEVLAVERGSATVTLWWREVGGLEAWTSLDAQVREFMWALGDLKGPTESDGKDESRR
ncbi:hypothetical protein BFW38_09330 [Terasakiispira papahanaumokuakeensis]|uniref:Preprotein translocase subunit YajC n=1 Tax=Terasakiispira papahanaumokuakeensis TaxID=197479 RepID=A0A1E2V9P6_9GAMM|nr:hypothetical protein [Terasakiispira papahanaumokuakeensis]ODC03711.1 hypothetical protein BFW38_09330 [Terasakiispira papahanaumokuakeensis]